MAVSMEPDDYLGRGYQPIAGKPFGWAWNMEREAIRRHLRRRLWRFHIDDGTGLPVRARLEFRVTKIQERIHKYAPTWRQRQEAARAAGEKWVSPEPKEAPPSFTKAELERMVEHFAGSNDELGASIAAKAAAIIAP